MQVSLTVNGVTFLSETDDKATLLSMLRDELSLSGAKFGCGEGECGACMVLVDGSAVPSCDLPLWAVQGKRVVTVEGLGDVSSPHPLQQALIEERAGQCGFCLPGIVVAAAGLLNLNTDPTREHICEALQRNLCRCGSHNRIIRAVQCAAKRIRESTHERP
jgi:nicotinate dehydrogenase subunit A